MQASCSNQQDDYAHSKKAGNSKQTKKLLIISVLGIVVVQTAFLCFFMLRTKVFHKVDSIGAEQNEKKVAQKNKDVMLTKQIEFFNVIDLPGGEELRMVKVEAGSFEMSSRDGENDTDEVAHPATLTQDFYIAKTEVTQAQWEVVMGYNPSDSKGDNLPVEMVSWDDAMAFCQKLNEAGIVPKRWIFTLPTETQWEYAARGGDRSRRYKYSGSNNADEVAWYYENSGDYRLDDSDYPAKLISNHPKTHPVGKKKANELGLCDMSGNVCEWCLDDWQEDSSKLIPEFTRRTKEGNMVLNREKRAIRGGCYVWPASYCRSMNRGDSRNPHERVWYIGFRPALVPVQ